jgi:[acyl-carrier-protein] S-malonyltransferase
MAAILGETNRPIEEICADATGEAGIVVPANYNCPGQLVISGEEQGVERAMTLCKEAGAKRAIRLNVSGAFHSPLMASAAEGLSESLGAATFDDPHFAVYANVNAEAVLKAARAKVLLLDQLSKPVRWTDEILALAARFPNATYIEMGPGNVLTGLVKKIAPSLKTVVCGTAADVAAVRSMPT